MRSYRPYKRFASKTTKSGLNTVQKKQVKSLLKDKLETKNFQIGFAPAGITNSGTIAPVSIMLQSVDEAGRVGDTVNLEKLTFNFDCIASQATLGTWLAGDAYNNIRFILFRWYEDSANYTPLVADVLNTSFSSYTYMSPYNIDNIESGKMHIMYDKTYILENTPYWNGSTTLFASGQSSIHNDMNHQIYGRKLGRKKIHFNNNAINATGHIYMLLISDSGSTPHPYAQSTFTVSYTDA